MTRRISLALATLATGVALLAAAGFAPRAEGVRAGTAADAPRGGTLRMARFSDVDFVDPALAYAPYSWEILYATCAKLFNYPDAAGADGTRLVPEVVDRFSVSKNGRTYTFRLRQSFRFHTGASVTAQSFADAFNRVAQPKLRSPATGYMREVVGAAAVIDGKAESISGIRVLDRYRLQIRLRRPLGDFFVPLLANGSRVWGVNLDDPRIDRRIEAASGLRGEARRKAWADLDIGLMRENPPWAPLVYHGYPIFVSQSTGCVVAHPVYLFDIAAACKK